MPPNLPTQGYKKKLALKSLLQKQLSREHSPAFIARLVVICRAAKPMCRWHVRNVAAPGSAGWSGVEQIVRLHVQQQLS